MINRPFWLGLGLALAVTACSDGPAGPLAGDLDALADPDVPTFDVAATGANRGGPCTYSDADGRFVCPEVNRNGLTITRTFTLYDAAGNVQSQYDALTTASMRTETSVKGTGERRHGGVVTVDRSGVMVVTGMAGEETERTLNGGERGTMVHEFTARDGAAVKLTHVVRDTTEALVIPVPRSSDRRWPLSGARVHAVSSTHVVNGGEPRTMTHVVRETFDGTSVVQVEITTDRGTITCARDLATRASTCPRPGMKG